MLANRLTARKDLIDRFRIGQAAVTLFSVVLAVGLLWWGISAKQRSDASNLNGDESGLALAGPSADAEALTTLESTGAASTVAETSAGDSELGSFGNESAADVTLSGRVLLAADDSKPVANVTVRIYSNSPDQVKALVATLMTSPDGDFDLSVPGGCYQAEYDGQPGIFFTDKTGLECYEEGSGSLLATAQVLNADSCQVRLSEDVPDPGVVVTENNGEFAESYTFRTAVGDEIVSTQNLSPIGDPETDDVLEWMADEKFDSDEVYFLTATRNGIESSQFLACERL